MKTFVKKSIINCNIDKLFNFHLNSKNLEAITPDDIQLKVLTKDYEPKVGKTLKLKSKKYNIEADWEVKIIKIEPPRVLVDHAVESPFKFWQHTRILTPKGNKTELKDIINYIPPFGIIGKGLNFFIKNELQNMFDYRHEKTKTLLERKTA